MEKIKTITFGDIHGLDIWKKIADTEFLLKTPNAPIMDYDKYIFVGDYVDSFKKTNNEIYENLVEIIKFKKMYPDNVVLLWGNHDVQYLTSFKEHGCSGFRGEGYFDLHEIFRTNRDLFRLSFQIGKYIWTHAGITNFWYKKEFPYNSLNVAQDLNTAFVEGNESVFDVGYARGGVKLRGGPLWADKIETMDDPLEGYHQIVGHTRLAENKPFLFKKNDITSVAYVDCLQEKEGGVGYELNLPVE